MEKTRKKNMVMTNEDIVRSYREAKDRRAQIKVLAELNVCPQELIIEILKEGGIDWRELPKARKKKEETAFTLAEKAPSVELDKADLDKGSKAEGNEAKPSEIMEEALQLLRGELVRQCRDLKEEYEAALACFADKIGKIDLMLCGQVCDDKEVSA